MYCVCVCILVSACPFIYFLAEAGGVEFCLPSFGQCPGWGGCFPWWHSGEASPHPFVNRHLFYVLFKQKSWKGGFKAHLKWHWADAIPLSAARQFCCGPGLSLMRAQQCQGDRLLTPTCGCIHTWQCWTLPFQPEWAFVVLVFRPALARWGCWILSNPACPGFLS